MKSRRLALMVFPGIAALLAGAAALLRGARADRKTAAEGIARHAGLYDGLYEGLCQILDREEPTERDTLKEWCGRTARLEGEAAYRAAFSRLFDSALDAPEEAYRKKLSLLLKLISAAGVTRGETGSLPYDASTGGSYLYLDEGAPAEGEIYKIVKPRWTLGGKTVEQGILMKGGQ